MCRTRPCIGFIFRAKSLDNHNNKYVTLFELASHKSGHKSENEIISLTFRSSFNTAIIQANHQCVFFYTRCNIRARMGIQFVNIPARSTYTFFLLLRSFIFIIIYCFIFNQLKYVAILHACIIHLWTHTERHLYFCFCVYVCVSFYFLLSLCVCVLICFENNNKELVSYHDVKVGTYMQ